MLRAESNGARPTNQFATYVGTRGPPGLPCALRQLQLLSSAGSALPPLDKYMAEPMQDSERSQTS